MASLHHIPPPRTPSPKIRIHRSQSFTSSPSSRISVTPIDESPYSKSTSAIIPRSSLPQYDALAAAERSRNLILHTKLSEDEDDEMSDSSLSGSDISSTESSPTSESSDYALFSSASPAVLLLSGRADSPMDSSSSRSSSTSPSTTSDTAERHHHNNDGPPEIMESSIQLLQYQDASVPMFDPWLVRVVLDLYDVRRFEWMMIAEPIERIWGIRTSSAEVLEILSANGRLRRCWWD